MSEHIFHIKDGSIQNKGTVKSAFILSDGRYLLKIDRFSKRSNQQNKYYHGCLVPIVKDGLRAIGYDDIKTHEDAHEVIKELFLKKKIANITTGEYLQINGSTATLTTVEFNELIEEIIKWGAEFLGIQIPYPGELITLNF